MTTLVGTQSDFAMAVKEAIELDFDAKEAYEVAESRLENAEFKKKMQEFCQDHERHIHDLSQLLTKHGETAPTGPSMKQWLTKGKAMLGSLVGDPAILLAMHSNEEDTNTAYERMTARADIWEDAVEILKKAFEDEKKHKQWLEKAREEA